jgi:tetratricopeptide (TPR) repeat protein
MEMFARARAAFVQVGSQADRLDVDARVAECFVFRGLPDEALEHAYRALADVERLDGVSVQTPLLQRIRGNALMQLVRWEEAAEAFEISLAVAEARQAPYDVALTLRSMAQLASAQGGDALEVERKSDDLLRSLGVVAVPEVLVGEPTARSAGSRVLRYGRVPSLGSRSEVRT